MCTLCSNNEQERKDIREGLHSFALQLERLAQMMRDTAEGRLKPHTKEYADRVVPLAHSVIRSLVQEWM